MLGLGDAGRDGCEAGRARAAGKRGRLQQAVRVSGIGIFDHDQRTDTIYWSPDQRRIYGWDEDEPVTLQKFIACVHPEISSGSARKSGARMLRKATACSMSSIGSSGAMGRRAG